MSWRFLLTYACRSLQRGGQRTLLAVVCVAFGVLSLVALQQLARDSSRALVLSPRQAEGGDVVLTREDEAITDSHVAVVAQQLDRVSPQATIPTLWIKTAGSGRAHILASAKAVDPDTFPLYGDLKLASAASPASVLRVPGDAIVSLDTVNAMGLEIGDRFAIFGSPTAPPIELRLGAIAVQTPDHQGRSVFIGLPTAEAQGLGGPNRVLARSTTVDAEGLEAAGWKVRTLAEEPRTQEAELLRFMFAGAGILGLLIGGIGVANTMQVLLARRTAEVAALKTLGYRQSHLLALFGLEAAILGGLGSLLGVVLGLPLSRVLMSLIDANMPTLMEPRFHPSIILGGLLVGTVTTVIFGMAAIVRASHVRPATLLRSGELRPSRLRRLAGLGLYGLLLVLFGILSSLVLGSLPKGFGIVALGVVGFALLGLLLAGCLGVVVRLPVFGAPILRLAQRNLRYQRVRSLYALVALFVGVVAIGFATIAILNASALRESRQLDLDGTNVLVYATPQDEGALRETLSENGVDTALSELWTELRFASSQFRPSSVRLVGRATSDLHRDLVLADSLPAEVAVLVRDEVLSRNDLELGDTVSFRRAGRELRLRISAVFKPQSSILHASGPPPDIIVDRSSFEAWGIDDSTLQLLAAVPPSRISKTTQALGTAVPGSVAIGKNEFGAAINDLLLGFFWFAISVASLALVAGAVLIANAVALSMLERKRELGVLKAVGFTRRSVLVTVLLENSWLGAVGGGAGVLGLFVVVGAINLRFPDADLVLKPLQAAAFVAIAVVLAALSSLLVAWQPTRLRPSEVLRSD